MSKRALRRTRVVLSMVSVIALAMMFPTAAFAYDTDGSNFGSIVLEKNCSDGLGIVDSAQCSFNVAAPKGEQEVTQKATNLNLAATRQDQYQKQYNVQAADASVENKAYLGFQLPIAAVVTFSGSSTATGHDADVDVHAHQNADAGNYGHVIAATATGDAPTGAYGDTNANGGFTGIRQNSEAEIEGEDAVVVGGWGHPDGRHSHSAKTGRAENVGDNASAYSQNNASSGNAPGGQATGHYVIGGITGGNTTSAAMVGGTATNVLGVQVNQSGNVGSTSGNVTNSGAASASSSNWVDQSAQPRVNQTQNPSLRGSVSASQDQSASSCQLSDPEQNISSGWQDASGSARSSVTVRVPSDRNES